jgi:surfeit locus 1 family protein
VSPLPSFTKAMAMYFRPLPGFTLLCTVLFGVLVALGVWQLDRLHWKLALIAEIHRNMMLPPIGLDAALVLPNADYRRVSLTGRFLNSREAYVYTTGAHGDLVYHVLTPFVLGDGRTVMVDRGLVPPALRDPATRKESTADRVTGVWRTPDKPGPFTPSPDLAHRVWYARDLASIAEVDHVKIAAPTIVEADATPNPGGWPEGGQTRINLPNDHLQYALTWFFLAASLVGVYLAYHRARGRLGLRPRT